MLPGLSADLRYAFRFLRTRPSLVVGVVLTLAVGLGLNIVIFSAVRALVVAPLPFPDPSRLVMVEGVTLTGGATARTSWPDYGDLAAASRRLSAIGALQIDTLTVRADREAERVRGALVTASLFDALGLSTASGRRILPGDDRPGAAGVVVLGHGYWQRRFGGAHIVGRTVSIDGAAHTIVGVLPRGVDFPGGFADVWLPLGASAPSPDRSRRGLIAIGRMAPGASMESVQAELTGIAARLASAWPGTNRGWTMRPVRLQEHLRRAPVRALAVLWAAVAALLLIACANIANMLLARAVERHAEVRVRAALGASRGRLVRQLLVESLLLALAGGGAGLLVARWATTAVGAALGGALVPAEALALDGSAFLFGLAACLATGLAFGLAPALQLSRAGTAAALAHAGRSGTATRSTARWQSALTVAEVAAAVTLLVSAGILMAALQRMQAADVGFRPDHVLTAEVSARGTSDSPAARAAFFDAVLAEVAVEPGVLAAAAVNWPPMTSDTVRQYAVGGRESDEPITAGHRVATPGYLQAIGLAIREGRFFEAHDSAGSLRVAVVNAALAHRAWPGARALGQRIAVRQGDRDTDWLTVVGVVENVRHLGPGHEPEPEVFVPLAQHPADTLYLVVRTAGDPGSFAPALAAIVRRASPDAPLTLVRPMTQVIGDFLAAGRALTGLVAAFALVALVLSSTGLVGVIGCVVGQRAREFGIRLALGATPRGLLGLVLRRAMALASGGLAIGLASGVAAARLMRAWLYDGIGPEPWVFAAVAAVVAGVAIAASMMPVGRLLRSDPLAALREN